MRRVALVICTVLVVASLAVVTATAANNFPSQPAPAAVPLKPGAAAGQPQPFYGYVPPAPVRHTWPGGYRVIFHELMNTFTEHMLGQY
jgi:hypothetical protein